MMEDNQGAIGYATNVVISDMTKHIDVKCHFVKDHVEAGTVRVNYIATDLNTADMPNHAPSCTVEACPLCYGVLAKNGPTATEADRVFAELAHAKLCTPRRIAVSGQLDQLRRAFDDKTLLEISLSAAGKARAAAAFAKATPDKPSRRESAERRQQREQAEAARKAAATAASADKAKAKVTK
eukprot:jgi/Tetstr1/437624/TSEL_026291.t1